MTDKTEKTKQALTAAGTIIYNTGLSVQEIGELTANLAITFIMNVAKNSNADKSVEESTKIFIDMIYDGLNQIDKAEIIKSYKN